MSEQRKDSRKKLMAFTPVYDSIARSLLGYVGNINLLGLMVISEHPVEVDREVMLNIKFPNDSVKKGDQTLITPARVAWCKQDDSPKSWNSGFEFTNLTTEQKTAIGALLDRYHFRYND
jgi:hypothetical protein